MANEETKDTILTLYFDILREIEINDEFAKTGNFKQKLIDAKRELKNILRATEDLPRSERLSFTQQPRNLIKMLEGKDYYFTISDGFEVWTIKKSTIESKKEDTPLYILKRFKKNVARAINDIKNDKEISKELRNKKLDALGRLTMNIDKNAEVIKGGAGYTYDDYWMNKINDEAYPIFQDVNALSIRLNI